MNIERSNVCALVEVGWSWLWEASENQWLNIQEGYEPTVILK